MKNSKLRRILLTLACAVLLVSLSVGATLAYLTSTTAPVNNVFTVGNVKISLDETTVEYKKAENYWKSTGGRTNKNSYKILPGVQIDKDPTVYVEAESEDCYVRAIISVTYSQEADAWFDNEDIEPLTWVTWTDSWTKPNAPYKVVETEETVTRLYEVRYSSVVTNVTERKPLPAIFTKIDIPEELNNDQIALLADFRIDVIAHAIQADGFTTADLAWAEFDLPDAVPVPEDD